MKGKYLIAVAFLASWTVITASKWPVYFEAADECPAQDPCPPKLISHETDCTKYYECKYGRKLPRSCAAGLYFSKTWHGCVNQEISDCPVTPPTTTLEPPDCVEGDLIEHECDCIKFYECINGRKALRNCPAGKEFNRFTKTCELGSGNDCKNSTIPPPCKEGELLPHECQCTKYYLCKGGRKALRECENGTHFDETLRKCIPGECGKPLQCIDGDRKKHECPSSCDKFYECSDDEWLVEFCPDGKHFNEATRTCMNPIDAGCDPTIKPKPGDCPTTSPPKWPHECDCRLYYQCENGKKKIYECNWGSYFHNNTLKCDVVANATCKNEWDEWTFDFEA